MKHRQITFLTTIIVFATLNVMMGVRADNRFLKAFAASSATVIFFQLVYDARNVFVVKTTKTFLTILETCLAATLGIGIGAARYGIINDSGNLKLDRVSIAATAIFLTILLTVTVFVYRLIGRSELRSRKIK